LPVSFSFILGTSQYATTAHGTMTIQNASSGINRKAIRKNAASASTSAMTATNAVFVTRNLVILKDLPDVTLLGLHLLILSDLLKLLALDDMADR